MGIEAGLMQAQVVEQEGAGRAGIWREMMWVGLRWMRRESGFKLRQFVVVS